jgi:hypothetical protein
MGYDPIGELYTGSPKASIDPLRMQQSIKEDAWLKKQLDRQEKEAQETEHLRREREKLRIQRTGYALDKLKIPGLFRGASEPEWQLHQWAAGFTNAPAKPPIDWDRMNFAERERLRKYWR